MRRGATRGRLGAAALVLVSVLTAAGAGASSAIAATAPRVLSGSVAPMLPAGAKVTGALSGSARLTLDIELATNHPARLSSLLAGLYDPASPDFHRFLAPGQFASQFGATPGQLRSIDTWLRSAGMTPTGVSANRLVVHAVTVASVATVALRTSFVKIRTADGRAAFANRTAPTVPATVAGIVTGIVGLDDLSIVHSHIARLEAARRTVRAPAASTPQLRGPRACFAVAQTASLQGSFTASGLASYYAVSPLYALGDLGQAVHIAVAEFEYNSSGDIATFQHCYRTAANVSYVAVDGGPTDSTSGPNGSGEAALDIENLIGLAPRSSVDVFQSPNSDTGQLDLTAALVASGDRVITTSWGSCEPETTPSVISGEQTSFQQANAQGQVVFAAAGDSGSTDCFPSQVNMANDKMLTVDDPASQPFVLGVGGTTAARGHEVVWDDQSGGAGGGGISMSHCMPAYQANPAIRGIFTSNSKTNPTLCTSGPTQYREVPDVTGVADPSTGYTIYWQGGWGAIGGTSGAAPLWAGAAALVLASPYCRAFGSTVGVSPQALYALAASPSTYAGAFSDITKGRNALRTSGYLGGQFLAGRGYDEASGLGSPQLTHVTGSSVTAGLFRPGLASLLCFASRTTTAAAQVTNVVPRLVASTRPTTVTIVGSGFLAIAGADHVAIDGREVAATCTTSTRCTATLPGLPAATAHLRVEVQTYYESPATSADLVTFVHAPKVASIAPRAGPKHGGTRIVIRGTGFTGSVTVRFGARAASHVTVVSSKEVVVTAPAGTGAAYVVVAARGGRSARTPAGLYRY